MKKFLIIIAVLCLTLSFSKKANAVTLQGKVVYDTVLTAVSSGYVKALKLNKLNLTLSKVDSVNIGAGGTYTLNVNTGDTVYIVAYASAFLDFVPGYYPGTNNWITGTAIIANTAQTNLDVKVRKLYNSTFPGRITGTVSYNNGVPLKDAIIYLKTQIGEMISYGISNADGSYSIPNVAEGSYLMTTNRIAFNNTSVFGVELNYAFGTELPNQNFSLQQTVSIRQIGTETPDKFILFQNYPNPFNPQTKIKFSLAKASDVKLAVFNSQGKLVQEVLNRYIPAGSFEIDFDAKNLSSGIYYYKIESNEFSSTKKMTLVK
ncbi:MAG: T9SS type A sorting domain-containing protein [Bacteroidetes bacterium]|nr:T9SS type A sorting domain-containing protein [Bacteroidota bacterium]